MRNILWICLGAALLITSCGSKQTAERAITSSESATSEPAVAIPVADSIGSAAVIRTAELRLQFDSLLKARQSLSLLVRKYQGYIAHEQESRYDGRLENRLEIRVPQLALTALSEEICSKAKYVEQKELNVDDVSMEYTDVQARLQAKQELEKRYLQLLQRTGKISEMLEVEQQMNVVRSEIEVMQGRLNYLNNKVATATLTVSMYELLPSSLPPQRGFLERAAENFTQSFHLLQEALLLLISLWPLMLIPAIVVTILFSRRKKPTIAA